MIAIDPSKTPLFRVLGEAVGQTIADLHRAHGVRTVFEDTVAAFEGTGRVGCVVTKGGQRLECDFVVVGIGIEPAVDMLEGSGIHVDNGVVVDEYCQTNVSGIYAAGDVANHYHPVFDRRIRVEHWQNAIKQGGVAARNMLGRRVPCTTRSTGSGLISTTRTSSTPDSTRSGSSSSCVAAWTRAAFWRVM